jgi:hypothetical protein
MILWKLLPLQKGASSMRSQTAKVRSADGGIAVGSAFEQETRTRRAVRRD